MQVFWVALLKTCNHDRLAEVYVVFLPPGPTGAHPIIATKLSCHFRKPCLTFTYRLGSKAVRTGLSSANLLTEVASDLAKQFDCGDRLEASSLHVGPLQKRVLEGNNCGNRYYDRVTEMLFPLPADRCRVGDVSCCPSSYILPVASHLDPSLVSAPDTSSHGPPRRQRAWMSALEALRD